MPPPRASTPLLFLLPLLGCEKADPAYFASHENFATVACACKASADPAAAKACYKSAEKSFQSTVEPLEQKGAAAKASRDDLEKLSRELSKANACWQEIVQWGK